MQFKSWPSTSSTQGGWQRFYSCIVIITTTVFMSRANRHNVTKTVVTKTAHGKAQRLTREPENNLQIKGRFTLWPKVERPSVSTNQISRNQEFGLSTLHTRGRSPKSVALFLPTWQHFFDQSDGLSKGVWVVQEWKPKVWSRGRRIFSLKKLDSDKIWTVRLERLFFNKA